MMQDSPLVLLAAFSATFLASIVIVLTKGWHGRLTFDGLEGAQKFHVSPTPRVGGVAVVVGVVTLLVSGASREVTGPLLLAGMLAFATGLAEDLTQRVGVASRLVATIGSGLVACMWTGYWLTGVDVPGVDLLVSYPVFAVPFTAIAIAGVANAFNMIDGFNGLAPGASIIITLAMGTIALSAGDSVLASACFGMSAVMAGFLVVNFPLGKLFLGDGGAYFVGFAIAWFAVLLAERNPQVSPWAGITVCAYPVLEMFFSMWRKARRDGHHPSRPDGLHLHMLVHRRLVRRWLSGRAPVVLNAGTAPVCWCFALVPSVLAVVFSESTPLLMGSFLVCALLYAALYGRLTRFRWMASGRLHRQAAGSL